MTNQASQSRRGKSATHEISLAIEELQNIAAKLDTFDATPSEVQRQIDAFVNSLHKARLLKQRTKKRVKLHEAVKDLTIKIAGRDKLVHTAESLEDLINDYEDEIDEEDAEIARELADSLVEALGTALEAAITKQHAD
jgi:hypothetical protein